MILTLTVVLGTRASFVLANDSQLTHISDTIGNSAPGVSTTHSIKFQLTTALPVSGSIIITPQPDEFTVSASAALSDLAMHVQGLSEVLAQSPNAGTGAIGVQITTGTTGSFIFTLPSNVSFNASSQIVIAISNNIIQNPNTEGSYQIEVQTYAAGGVLLDHNEPLVAIINGVTQGTSVPSNSSQNQPPPNPPTGPVTSSGSITDSGPLTPKLSPPNPPPSNPSLPGPNPAPAQELFYVYPNGEISPTIDPAHSNAIGFNNGLLTDFTIYFPELFYIDPVVVHVSEIDRTDPALAHAGAAAGLKIIGNDSYHVVAHDSLTGVPVYNFAQPLTVSFTFTDAQIQGFDPNTLQLYGRTDTNGAWQPLNAITRDFAENKISGQVGYIGYFELLAKPLPAGTANPQRIGDFNHDGFVDLKDFSIMMANWGTPVNKAIDLNADRVVDEIDLAILLYWWTGPYYN